MKSKLTLSTRGIKNIDEYADALWAKYTKDLSTVGSGEFQPKSQFKSYLKIYYSEGLEDGLSKSSALKYAAKRYQNSSFYFSDKERVASFTVKDLIQSSNKDDIRRFRNLTRNKLGQFTKYDPNKFNYIGRYERNGIHYTVNTYQDVVFLTFNSPFERVFFSRKNVPAEYEMYLQGVNIG